MGNLDRFRDVVWNDEIAKEMPRHQNLIAVIVGTEVVPVGNFGDQDLEVEYEVLDGPSKGRRIMQHIPLFSSDSERYLRGKVFFRALCRSIGVSKPSDSSELHGKPLVITVSRKFGYEDRPIVFHYEPCSESKRDAWKEWAAKETERLDAEAQTPQEETEATQ